jgi:ribA/ribD-fused uncharacterized protein
MKIEKKIDQFNAEYRWLSNFWLVRISPLSDQIVYPSVEHAYQAAKTKDLSKRVLISCLNTPAKAKQYGKTIELPEHWHKERELIMLSCLRCKFSAGSELADKLIQTGNSQLEEGNYWGDTFWGVCNGVGKNKLGKLLMQVRSEIRVFSLI